MTLLQCQLLIINNLLGIITIDDILDVMDEEASEYSRLAGVSDIDSTNDSVVKTATKRLPWLIILTFLGMITATILVVLKQHYHKLHY